MEVGRKGGKKEQEKIHAASVKYRSGEQSSEADNRFGGRDFGTDNKICVGKLRRNVGGKLVEQSGGLKYSRRGKGRERVNGGGAS